jgi:hypothetical protein
VGVVSSAGEEITVQGFQNRLFAARGKKDEELARQFAWLRLTERLSPVQLLRRKAQLPGPESRLAFMALVDTAEFLDLPASELPDKAVPNPAEQSEIISLALQYVSRTLHQLPNFLARRVTSTFQDLPQTVINPYEPLHLLHISSATVLYADRREIVETGVTGRGKLRHTRTEPWAPLTTLGVFGPILGRVLVDGEGTLTWSHWEQGPTRPEAVFRYTVAEQKSHYQVDFCCNPGKQKPSSYKGFPAYHGEIAIDPRDGTIRRLTLRADLEPSDVVARADIMVEYGPVEIGGKTYICPLRSVSLQMDRQPSATNQPKLKGDALAGLITLPEPVQILLNDVVFDNYHVFRPEARMLSGYKIVR